MFLLISSSAAQTLTLPEISDQAYTEVHQVNVVLPAASGGTSPYTYILTPALPAGLSFTASTRTISGSPTAPMTQTQYTLMVIDPNGAIALQTFYITVNTALSLGTIANQTYMENQQITDLVLPAATGGTGSITYSISPSLPGGLSFAASTRTLSGTPTSSQTAQTYTYTATDANGATASQTFNITVNTAMTLGTIPAILPYTQNYQKPNDVLPVATGGTTPITYSLSPALPTGLSFTASTRTISGTPTGTMDLTQYTYTATDANGATVSKTFRILVGPQLGCPQYTDQTYYSNFALGLPGHNQIMGLTFNCTGGTGAVSKSVSPSLPAGLTVLNNSIGGTPTETVTQTEYTLTVEDQVGATFSQTFNLTVKAGYTVASVEDQSFTRNHQITDLVLPAPANATGTFTHALPPVRAGNSLPTGLTFNASTRTLSGTPTAVQAETEFQYQTSDAVSGLYVHRNFSITVYEQLSSFPAIQHQTYMENQQITDLVLPAASGGASPYTYTLTPALPTGLTFTASTRTISGTPTSSQTAQVYTYTATDANGATTSRSLTITVDPALSLGTVSNQTYTQNQQITDLVLPAASGGTSPYTYTLTPALPTGLTFTASTRTVSGTPSVVKSETEYTFQVTDSDGTIVSQTFDLTVNAALSLGTVANQTYTQSHQITDLVLPAAAEGTGSITYSISPSLPSGLSFAASTRTLSGTPTSSQTTAQTYTYTATDANGATASQTFTITVNTALSLGTIANQTYTENQQITDLVLPAATGGTGSITYSISPSLPGGLSFAASTRTLSGTPTSSQTAQTYTYTATDANGATISQTFTITVDGLLSLGTIADQTYTQNQQITDLVLPAASGGTSPYTYTLTPALPTGLTFTASTRTLSGTPTSSQTTAQTYTYKAADANGATALQTFTITVNTALSLGTIANQTYTENQQITDLVLPAATGGTGSITYSISPSLPGGLSFAASTRTLSGTPTSSQTAQTYTYTATDANGATISQTFTITVDGLLSLGTIADQTYTQNQQITDLVLPAASGGTSPYTYTLTPALPTGLTFTASTRTVSGTPSVVKSETEYTFQVTDSDGTIVSQTFDLTVNAALSLGTVANQTYTQSHQITDLVLPAAAEGTGSITYSISPSLPSGLSFAASTRTLSGTPTSSQTTAQTYTYTATDANGATASQTFNITVNTALSLGTIANQTYTENQQITDLVLPAATGGTGSITYSISPSLPGGLSFAASTRTLSGTPTSSQTAQTYTYTATDANGATISQTFTITVNTALSLGTIANQTYTQNQQITDLVLPAASGGTSPYTYTLTPALPTGLTFTASTRTVSGTPSAVKAQTQYTYTATDANGTTAVQTFNLTVNAALSLGTVFNQTYTQNQQITDLVLPAASGGTSPYTYTLTPALPTGLTFTASTRTVSGTPSVIKAQTQYTYTAMDANGTTAVQTFNLTVNAVLSLGTVFNQTYTQNQQITDLVLPAASGGTSPYTYTLTPALPTGLTFTASTRTISGTPISSQTAQTYTYVATDVNGGTASQTFTITVDVLLSLGTIANQTYTQNQQITDLVLPAVVGGTAPYTYALTPALPTGLTFTASTRTVSGTPTSSQTARTYTYVATDANGVSASVTFTITVKDALALVSIADQIYLLNQRIVDFILPAATGGMSPYTYSLTPNLPTGLVFDQSARTISGTPTAIQPATIYRWEVEDSGGTKASVFFTLTVKDALTLGSIINQIYMQNQPIADLVLPAAMGGTAPYTYRLSGPPLPSGLSFTVSTRTISGTPTAVQSAKTYTWEAEDSDGTKVSIMFDLTVQAALVLESISNQIYTQGQPIASLALPQAFGGQAPYTYELSPALPTGLTFNPESRILSGTPTAAKAETAYTYTVTDALEFRGLQIFNITVFPRGAEILRVFGNYPNPSQSESTNLEVSLTRDCDVRVEVFNLLGRRVIDQQILRMEAGENQKILIEWMGVESGLYLYRITATSTQQVEIKTGRIIRIN